MLSNFQSYTLTHNFSDYNTQLSKSGSDLRYSYGWHRAEILAALINGVFLLALCFSISLEAIERFFALPGENIPTFSILQF